MKVQGSAYPERIWIRNKELDYVYITLRDNVEEKQVEHEDTFVESYVAVLRKNKDYGYTLFTDGDTHFINDTKEILSALGYSRIKLLYRIPTNKKTTL